MQEYTNGAQTHTTEHAMAPGLGQQSPLTSFPNRRAATFLHDQVGLRRGDRLATILFNHDVTVVLYFAAWSSGITVVPINVEEPTDKKRFILEHSEASAVCCWHSSVEGVHDLQRDLPALRHVIALNDDGVMENKSHGARGETRHGPVAPGHASHTGVLEDEALVVYTSGTTGPPKGVVLTVENLLIDADAIADWHHRGGHGNSGSVLSGSLA